MQELLLRVEVDPKAKEQSDGIGDRLQNELRNDLGIRINVEIAPAGSLPRYELKARRFKHQPPD